MATKEKTASESRISTRVLIVLLLLAIAGGAGGMYVYTQYFAGRNADEVTQIQSRLASFMVLPQEAPTFATVSDITKLRNQPFFARAANGDKLLIYPRAKKAILYRPSTGKVIDVGPINVGETGQSSPSATSLPTTSQPIRIAIYNGTPTNGLAKIAQEQIEQSQPNLSVTKRADAAKNDYDQTIVVDLTKKGNAANAIATLIKGKLANLPSGEEKPDADILIILGGDYATAIRLNH